MHTHPQPKSLAAFLAIILISPSSFAEDKAALSANLHAAEAGSSLEAPGLRPWHLKLAVQLYDDKGAPTDAGTIEEWWHGASARRVTYALPNFALTEVHNAQGDFRTKDAPSIPIQLEVLLNQVLHPMPPPEEIDAATPYLEKKTFGKVQLDCIMLTQPLVGVPFPPIGLFPTYCFDPGSSALRLSYNYGSQLIARNAVGKFQGKSVATDILIQEVATRTASAKVVTLESRASDATDIDPVVDLAPVIVNPVLVASGVIAGSIIEKVPPIYPEGARQRHVSGTVLLHAIIGRDGRVHSLRFLKVPDSELAMAAVAAVRKWRYKPYLLNGEPTEVDTTITVNFNFSR